MNHDFTISLQRATLHVALRSLFFGRIGRQPQWRMDVQSATAARTLGLLGGLASAW